MKYALRLEEAIQFKAARGPKSECGSFRGILLMSTAG